MVYHRRVLPVRLLDSGRRRCRAVTYVANRALPALRAGLEPAAAAAAIARGIGQAGPTATTC